MSNQTGWVANASGTNSEITATKAAAANKQHIIYSVDASFASTATALLQIKDGTTVIWEGYVYDQREVPFPKGLSITSGNSVSAVLGASGGPAQKVNLHGSTK